MAKMHLLEVHQKFLAVENKPYAGGAFSDRHPCDAIRLTSGQTAYGLSEV